MTAGDNYETKTVINEICVTGKTTVGPKGSKREQMMTFQEETPLLDRLHSIQNALTPKGRKVADYVLHHPRDAVFMRTRELAGRCEVSEATIVRFVRRLGYQGYRDFVKALRDLVDSELTLVERVQLTRAQGTGNDRLGRVIFEEIRNLKSLYQSLDGEKIAEAARRLKDAREVYVIGSRLSYTFAYYLGWSLTKLRSGVRILPGSDSTAIDWLTLCEPPVLVVIIATSRYPNELLRLAKFVRRCGHELITLADSALCPLNHFAQLSLVAPCEHFPFIGSPSTLSCLINCLTFEMVNRDGDQIRRHQEKLERAFLENDILFNIERRPNP